jgi:hypothetical protein
MMFRSREAATTAHKGTRVVVGFDRTKGRAATPARSEPQQTAPAPRPETRVGLPGWIWAVVVVAIAAVVGFFLLNR